LSDDIQVFVDEFVTKMAEFCSADRPDPIEHRIAAE
jgi:biopolymer transport protein ExbB